MVVEIPKAAEPAINANQGFVLVEIASNNRASLSVSSAMKIATNIVAKAPKSVDSSNKIAKDGSYYSLSIFWIHQDVFLNPPVPDPSF